MNDVIALADLDRAIAGTETIVAGITAGQRGWPTPCTRLDFSTLVNHLVAGNLVFAARVTGTPLPDGDRCPPPPRRSTGWPASSAARYDRPVLSPADWRVA